MIMSIIKRVVRSALVSCFFIFSGAILASDVSYFGAEWCGACNRFKSEVLADPEVQRALNRGTFHQYDVDKNPDVARELGIQNIPTIIIDGKKYVGYMSKADLLGKLK